MFSQNILNSGSNSDYDSDNSNGHGYNSSNETNSDSNSDFEYLHSSCCSCSSSSFNSSNYSFTSEPVHYYRKDLLKQNHIKPKSSLSKRKMQTQRYLNECRNKNKYLREFNLANYQNDLTIQPAQCNFQTVGYDSGFNKNTPFIDYLINKRTQFCELGASSHIAAFIPITNNSRYCFIREWKGKDCFG